MATNYGVYVKAGRRRIAYTPADRVKLEFDGWSEVEPASVPIDPRPKPPDDNPPPPPPPAVPANDVPHELVLQPAADEDDDPEED